MAESRTACRGYPERALSQRLQLVSPGETNRGVKQAPFIVLTDANMPAVLSEISFVGNNPSDENLLLRGCSAPKRVAEGPVPRHCGLSGSLAQPARQEAEVGQ